MRIISALFRQGRIKTMKVRKCDGDDLPVLTTFNKCLIEEDWHKGY